MTGQLQQPTRDEKATNLLTNYTALFAGMFEETFAGLAATMSEITVEVGAAVADAMAEGLSAGREVPKRAKKSSEKLSAEIRPQISKEVKKMFSGIREEVSSQMSKDTPELRSYLANPAFDKGIAIVDKYDFKLPRLTEKLGDEDLASYLVLLKSADEKLGKMFKELAEWQGSLPKPPGIDEKPGTSPRNTS